MGLECEGLSEVFENVLNHFGRPWGLTGTQQPSGSDYRSLLLDYVLVTGGNTLTPGFDKRVLQELRMLSPSE